MTTIADNEEDDITTEIPFDNETNEETTETEVTSPSTTSSTVLSTSEVESTSAATTSTSTASNTTGNCFDNYDLKDLGLFLVWHFFYFDTKILRTFFHALKE